MQYLLKIFNVHEYRIKRQERKVGAGVCGRAGKEPSRSFKFYNHREGPYYYFLKAPTAAFTFKNLLRHYAKEAFNQERALV